MKVLETSVLKTIAPFLNGTEGGTLLIGVDDDGTVHGLDSDYATLRKEGRGDRDVFQLHLANIIGVSMGDAAGTAVSARPPTDDVVLASRWRPRSASLRVARLPRTRRPGVRA